MAQSDSKRPRNSVLRALPPDAYALLASDLEPVALPRRFMIVQPNRKIAHVYFLDSGIASIVASTADDAQIEVGIIGREGMTGIANVHDTDRWPYQVYMQVGGAGHRVPVAVLRAALADSAVCRRVFLAAAQGHLLQVSETAVANARGTIGERLARWLLMARDRVDDDEIPLTHEFIAMMMGARRPGVTEAIHDLSRRGLVVGERGKIVILDRAGLEEHAGSYYGVPERELRRLLG